MSKKREKQGKGGWQPMARAVAGPEPRPALVRAAQAAMPYLSEAGARRYLDQSHENAEYWVNDLYQVEVRRQPADHIAVINIRRRDGAAILRDWRHFQRIKNELVGPECEAIELYPAESRKVDTSNKYTLWAITDPGFRFPFGWSKRDIQNEPNDGTPGIRQRPDGEE